MMVIMEITLLSMMESRSCWSLTQHNDGDDGDYFDVDDGKQVLSVLDRSKKLCLRLLLLAGDTSSLTL